MNTYYEKRQTIRELRKLSQRELDDIGMTYDDIRKLESETSWFKELVEWAKRQLPEKRSFVDEYLAESTDRVDLERREKELVKMGLLPW